jgi:hypothetical protein
MSPRATALAGVLHHELVRVGLPGVVVSLEPDDRTVTLEDAEGRWRGPLPAAYGALVGWGDGEASSSQLWQRLSGN